jgi:hypothetical protein
MFIGQASSIDGVCMVYGLNPFVHHSNCLYNSINSKEEKGGQLRVREAIEQGDWKNQIILAPTVRKRERERQLRKRLIVRRRD